MNFEVAYKLILPHISEKMVEVLLSNTVEKLMRSFVGSLDVKSNMIDDLEKLKNTT